ncbi:MAG: PAS domain S-box protein [Candidatus Thermoplasmatota archaeon]
MNELDITKGEKGENLQKPDNLLVMSIDQNGKIVFFNKQCEKQAGYYREEALDKKILDLLVPEEHKEDWEKIFDSVKKEESVNDFTLPLLTRDGQKIMASWDVAPVDVENKNLGAIGLVGQPAYNYRNSAESDAVSKKYVDKDGAEENSNNKVSFKFGNKKIVFKKPNFLKNPKRDKSDSSSEKESKNKDKTGSKNDVDTTDIEEDVDSELFEKYDPKKLKETFNQFDEKVNRAEELKKKIEELKKENKKLKEQLQKDQKEKHFVADKLGEFAGKRIDFLFDVMGGQKKKEEFENMMNELDKRKNSLNNLEKRLNKDKRIINKSRDEFVRWRQKLENVEDEIEKRREALIKKEQNVKKNLLSFVDGSLEEKPGEFKGDLSSEEKPEHHDMLDKVSTASAIVQRGVLRQVNDDFAEMLGFNTEELEEKSLFDFVAPEGLSGVENYYLNRLKGDKPVSSYETVLVTKDGEEKSIKMDVKPVLYRDEMADRIVVTDVESKPSSKTKKESSSEEEVEKQKNSDKIKKPV